MSPSLSNFPINMSSMTTRMIIRESLFQRQNDCRLSALNSRPWLIAVVEVVDGTGTDMEVGVEVEVPSKGDQTLAGAVDMAVVGIKDLTTINLLFIILTSDFKQILIGINIKCV